MSLDLNACLKAFSVAFGQYSGHPNEQTLKYVEKQIDVLTDITLSDKSLCCFNARELLPTECLTSLVSMLSEMTNKPQLMSKCLLLLCNFAKDSETRIMLRDSYHLTSTLTAIILQHNSNSSSKENIIFQFDYFERNEAFPKAVMQCDVTPCIICLSKKESTKCLGQQFIYCKLLKNAENALCLQLLQSVTYNCRFPVALSHIDNLVKFLVSQILGAECELTMPSLGVLTNLCRNNIAVQAQVKALDNIKYIYRSLVKYLSHHNLIITVYALSLITSLALKEPLGEKLFNEKNIEQTIQLLFNILINGEGSLSRKYSVDLFIDLLPSDKIKHFLTSWEYLAFYVGQSLNLLSKCEADEAEKIFELLLAFCGISDIRAIVYCVFESIQSNGDNNEQNDSFASVLSWMNSDSHFVSIKALEFLKEIYEIVISNGDSSYLMSYLKILLPNLVKNLEPPTNVEGNETKGRFEKIVRVLDVLAALCCEEEIVSYTCEVIHCGTFQQLVEQQYRLNDIAMKEKLTFTAEWSEVGVSVALKTLDLMNKLKTRNENIKETLDELMKDESLVSFLANTVSNGEKDDILTALHVLQESCKTSDFHMTWLGELIFTNNQKRVEEIKTSVKRQDDAFFSPQSFKPTVSMFSKDPSRPSERRDVNDTKTTTFIDDSTIESLIDKMKSGMEIKGTKTSELMDVYEAKLASLQTKERHLQDLLEAKTLALSQSDRMLSHHRCRSAQSEAECAKLRHMLQETEKRCEAQIDQIHSFDETKSQYSDKIEKLEGRINNLQIKMREHKQLKLELDEQTSRVKTLEDALAAAKKEHESIYEIKEMLRRHNDNLKNQHDCVIRKLHQLEAERKKIMQEAQLNALKINEQSEALRASAEDLQNKQNEMKRLEKSFNQNTAELAKNEQQRKELRHKVSSLELICSQHEEAIKQKEEKLKDQQAQLDKYAQVSAMFCSLASGNGSKK